MVVYWLWCITKSGFQFLNGFPKSVGKFWTNDKRIVTVWNCVHKTIVNKGRKPIVMWHLIIDKQSGKNAQRANETMKPSQYKPKLSNLYKEPKKGGFVHLQDKYTPAEMFIYLFFMSFLALALFSIVIFFWHLRFLPWLYSFVCCSNYFKHCVFLFVFLSFSLVFTSIQFCISFNLHILMWNQARTCFNFSYNHLPITFNIDKPVSTAFSLHDFRWRLFRSYN